MTWIKICGITNLEDALTAVDAGADALGFVFYEKSPRKIDPEAAREIVRQLPPQIEKVGVFVDKSVERIQEIAGRALLTAVQLHGDVRPGETATKHGREWTGKLFVVLPASTFAGCGEERAVGLSWSGETAGRVSAVFVDSGTSEKPGGTGSTFDWTRAAPIILRIKQNFRVVVAGGLTSANVREAILAMKPWGVDVASGVEMRAGKKDPDKVRAFVQAVRQADKSA
jgi:phosphoribosylanthranilate isomerase